MITTNQMASVLYYRKYSSVRQPKLNDKDQPKTPVFDSKLPLIDNNWNSNLQLNTFLDSQNYANFESKHNEPWIQFQYVKQLTPSNQPTIQ